MVDILDAMIDGWVNQIVMVIGQMPWLGPLLALIAGVLAAFTPCCLSSIPLIVGYISGLGEKTTKRAFLYSLTFAGGTACTFVALGLIATSVGHLLGTDSVIWHIILGLLMFLMALQIWDVINIIPETDVLEKNSRRGFVGAFLTGILAGIFASPCSTPILVALLAIIAGDGRFFWGILLMLCYAAGHSVLVLIAGTSVGFVQRLKGRAVLRYDDGSLIALRKGKPHLIPAHARHQVAATTAPTIWLCVFSKISEE